MMDGQLDWTESLGEAFIADPAAVTESVQRLRRQALVAGKLRSNAQQVVTDQDGVITIEPANAQTVYVPDYEPAVVYGAWPYPDWPPYYYPDYFEACVFDDFGYCWFGEPVIVAFWGWNRWDWHGHRIDIDRGRFTTLNHGRPPVGGAAWQHDPAHRDGVPYQSQAMRQHYSGASPDALRSDRGYPTGAAGPSRTTPGVRLPGEPSPPLTRRPAPTIESYGPGDVVRTQAERGQASRTSTPSYQPRGGAPSGGAAPGPRGRR
jgi:hypothetical protein